MMNEHKVRRTKSGLLERARQALLVLGARQLHSGSAAWLINEPDGYA